MNKVIMCSVLFQFVTATVLVDFWGFQPHKLINRQAVFTLPPPMLQFYKYHLHYITEAAVAADQRRYAIPDEAPKHYIDLDYYGNRVPRIWDELMASFPSDSIQKHGVLPWNLYLLRINLTEAFRSNNPHQILKLSADVGHYLADAHVPLHTTSNYNGQYTGQYGIHGFWETRVPELLLDKFDLWTGTAIYRENWYDRLWKTILISHSGVDSVLHMEKQLTETFDPDHKYAFEIRLNQVRKVYSKEFTHAYNDALNGQVEKRMRSAIRAIGDFWYGCWVDAGQPVLETDSKDILYQESDYQKVVDSLWRNQHKLR